MGHESSGAPVLPRLLQTKAAEDIYMAAAKRDDREYFPMWAGQSAGLIDSAFSAFSAVTSLRLLLSGQRR